MATNGLTRALALLGLLGALSTRSADLDTSNSVQVEGSQAAVQSRLPSAALTSRIRPVSQSVRRSPLT